MTAERKAALVEKVARALCQEKCAFYGDPPCWGLDPAEYVIEPWNPNGCDEPGCGALAHAALTVALEQAAKEIEGRRSLLNTQLDVIDIGREDAVYEICAAAIRAMIKE